MGHSGGRGPAPKDPARRARVNKDPIPTRVMVGVVVPQPELPGDDWPEVTRDWWAMWGESVLSDEFTATDWSELADTAKIHAAFWGGKLQVAAELRQRVAKFGATPEDRARLRIQFAQADEADAKRPPVVESARDRHGSLRELRPAAGE